MATIIRTVLPHDGGIELVYTTAEGSYLGRLTVEATGEGAMGVMAADLMDFLQEQKEEAERPRIAMAVGAALNGRN